MPSRSLAPRLRLLGLLLICASIIMGLLLSAAGVDSVNLSSPFAQQVAENVQQFRETGELNTSSFRSDLFGSRNESLGQSTIKGQLTSTANPSGWQTPPLRPLLNDTHGPGSALSHSSPVSNLPKSGPLAEEPYTISLWMLITPLLLLGVLLWMTPMPKANSATGSSRRYRR